MSASRSECEPFDLDSYVKRIQNSPCFICEIVTGNPDYRHHIIYEDDTAIAFLNKYPTLYAYTLVAPRKHLEQATGDFTIDEYLALQTIIHRIAEAIRAEVPTERTYILTLGSQQGNRHVHWHIAPLPPGVPYGEQQLEALNIGRGVLKLSNEEMAGLAGAVAAKSGNNEQYNWQATGVEGGARALLRQQSWGGKVRTMIQ